MITGTEILAAEVVKIEIIKKIGAGDELGENFRTNKLFFGAFISLKFQLLLSSETLFVKIGRKMKEEIGF